MTFKCTREVAAHYGAWGKNADGLLGQVGVSPTRAESGQPGTYSGLEKNIQDSNPILANCLGLRGHFMSARRENMSSYYQRPLTLCCHRAGGSRRDAVV